MVVLLNPVSGRISCEVTNPTQGAICRGRGEGWEFPPYWFLASHLLLWLG